MEKVLAIGAMLWAATMVSSPAMAHEGLAAVRADILAWASTTEAKVNSHACILKQTKRHVCVLRVDFPDQTDVRVILTNGKVVTYPPIERGGT